MNVEGVVGCRGVVHHTLFSGDLARCWIGLRHGGTALRTVDPRRFPRHRSARLTKRYSKGWQIRHHDVPHDFDLDLGILVNKKGEQAGVRTGLICPTGGPPAPLFPQ